MKLFPVFVTLEIKCHRMYFSYSRAYKTYLLNLLYDQGQVKMNIGNYIIISRNNPKKPIHLNITKDTDPQRLFSRPAHFLS